MVTFLVAIVLMDAQFTCALSHLNKVTCTMCYVVFLVVFLSIVGSRDAKEDMLYESSPSRMSNVLQEKGLPWQVITDFWKTHKSAKDKAQIRKISVRK